MTKQSGLAHGFIFDSKAVLSSDVNSVGRISCARATLDGTGIDKTARERLFGLASGGMDVSAFWNTTGAHPEFSDLLRADQLATYLAGLNRGDFAACVLGKQLNYDPTRGTDGSLLADVTVDSNAFSLEWGRQLTSGPIETFAGAGTTAGVDDESPAAAQDFGLQAYLHVLAFTGTSATITIEDSDDNGTDPWTAVTGAAFTAVTAPGVQRIETGRTENVKQWQRLNITGTFSDLQCAVIVNRNHAVSRT